MTAHARSDRELLARKILAPLLLAIAAGVLLAPWHSAVSIDSRTYIEMIRGITEHGLPYMYNGPVGDFPELQYAWNIAREGRLWGSYPPVYAYLAAPVFLAGGLTAVTKLSFLLLGAFVLGAYALGRRTTRDPLLGAFSAYVACLSTGISLTAFDIGSYTLAVALITWAFVFAVRALDEAARAARRMAACAGVLGGLAVGAHLLTLPMFAIMVVALGWLPTEGAPPLLPSPAALREWMPTRASIGRGACALFGGLLPLGAVATLNHARFGSWSPITYGPCVWRRCNEVRGNDNALALLTNAWPFLAWLVVTLVVIALARRWRLGPLVALAAATLVLVPTSRLHASAAGILNLAWAYVFDVSHVTMPPMTRATDGLGNFWGPYVIKSTLQATPAMALAVLAPASTRRDRQIRLLLGLPVIGLYALLVMRSNMPAAHALGFPFLNLRYVLPALPLAAALGVAGARELSWTPRHLAAVVVLGAAAAVVLGVTGFDDNDAPFLRRFLILRGTLLLAATSVLMTWMVRHRPSLRASATLVCTLCFASGFATNCGIDLPAMYALRFHNDRAVDLVASHTPARFALVGHAREVDIPLTLRATRDVEAADLVESRDWSNFRRLVERWSAEDRPIFGLWPPGWALDSPWPDVRFEVIDREHGFFRIVKVAAFSEAKNVDASQR